MDCDIIVKGPQEGREMKFFVIVTVAAIFGLEIGFSPIAPALLVTFFLVYKTTPTEISPPLQFF